MLFQAPYPRRDRCRGTSRLRSGWGKPSVRSGGTLKTAAGVLRILAVDAIGACDMSDRDHPGALAATLATKVGRDRDAFKPDVRKLKEPGLTENLEIGYRISPSGRTVLKHLSRGRPDEGRR